MLVFTTVVSVFSSCSEEEQITPIDPIDDVNGREDNDVEESDSSK